MSKILEVNQVTEHVDESHHDQTSDNHASTMNVLGKAKSKKKKNKEESSD